MGEKGNLGPGERHHISLRNDDRKTLVLVRNVKRERRSAIMQGSKYGGNVARDERQKKVTRSLQRDEVPFVIANPIDSPQKQEGMKREHATNDTRAFSYNLERYVDVCQMLCNYI